MGYIRDHAIVVVGTYGSYLAAAHEKASGIFPWVSPLSPEGMNGSQSFFVPPDGSKEGWAESEKGDECRNLFVEYLTALRYGDGSSPLKWVEVRVSDDNGKLVIERRHPHRPFRRGGEERMSIYNDEELYPQPQKPMTPDAGAVETKERTLVVSGVKWTWYPEVNDPDHLRRAFWADESRQMFPVIEGYPHYDALEAAYASREREKALEESIMALVKAGDEMLLTSQQARAVLDEIDRLRASLAAAETALGNVGKVERWIKQQGIHWELWCNDANHFVLYRSGDDGYSQTTVATAETLHGLGELLP